MEKPRRLPSSPHPGKDIFSQKKDPPPQKRPHSELFACSVFPDSTNDDVPSVSFNSLSASRLTPSTRSYVNLLRSTVPSPLKTPTSRSNLRSTGLSTSSLKRRKPLVVSDDKEHKSMLASSFSSSLLNTPESTILKTPKNLLLTTSRNHSLSTTPIPLTTPDLPTNPRIFNPKKFPTKSSLKLDKQTKSSHRISFGSLNVFYFGRDQGFEVVPKHGEISLGMEFEHFGQKQFKILETKRPKIELEDSDESELSEGEDPGFNLQCLSEKSPTERIRMLEAAGVVIDKSRLQCGCSCRGGVCKPASCECFRLGIKCQVDGPNDNGTTYPCTCYNADLCNNEYGRDEYNYERVSAARRAAIQRWKDSQKTGIYASPQVIKFEDKDGATSFQISSAITPTQKPISDIFGPRFSVARMFENESNRINDNQSDCTESSYFPPTKSLL